MDERSLSGRSVVVVGYKHANLSEIRETGDMRQSTAGNKLLYEFTQQLFLLLRGSARCHCKHNARDGGVNGITQRLA